MSEKLLRLGAAYHGNRMPHHAYQDLSDMASHGMNLVVHMFSHTDWERHGRVMKDIVSMSSDLGLEVSALCGMMAAELGMDVKKAKRAGLLHDIGKAVDHEVEGPHALIGADIAKKYNEGKDIVHAIAAHHEDQRPSTALAVLVQAADSISGARPGARKELLENYVKRLEELEGIATSFEGVSKAYAIQAGREIRVMVNPDNVDDDATYLLCKDIAEKIEKNLTYPGQIRVTVIRERRAMGFAK